MLLFVPFKVKIMGQYPIIRLSPIQNIGIRKNGTESHCNFFGTVSKPHFPASNHWPLWVGGQRLGIGPPTPSGIKIDLKWIQWFGGGEMEEAKQRTKKI